MYSVTATDNRVMIQCNFIKPHFVRCSAVYDTGAQSTIITALVIDPTLTEDDFKDVETINIGGLIDSNKVSIKGYKMHINDFYLGNIHITGVDVYVTFDERVTDNIVGMDVLSRVTRLGIEYSNQEIFFKNTQEMIDYTLRMNRNIKECLSNLEYYIDIANMNEDEAVKKCKNTDKYTNFEIREALKQYKNK